MIGDRGYNTNIEGNCLARAMYDNVAESPDELAFRKGDVLTVLEQNTAGLEGWWLCSLRGRQGICPGNRLRLLAGVYDTGAGVTSLASITPTTPTSSVTSTSRIMNTPVSGVGIIGVSSPAARMQRPLSKKVVTPKRVGDVFTYDSPRSHSLSNTPTHPQQHQQLDYDVPPTRTLPHDTGRPEVTRLSRSSSVRESYDVPRPVIRSSLEQYDVPRPTQPFSQYDTPKGQRMVSPMNQYDSPKAQFQYDTPKSYQQYDVPRSSAEATRGPRSLIKGVRGGIGGGGGGGGFDGNHEEYDVPRPATGSAHYDVPPSDRSSGVSVMSCESSHLSGSSSNSSLAASESLSLSSLGGSSNRSSLESHDVPVCDFSIENRRTSGTQQMRPKLPPRDPKDTYDIPKAHGDAYDTPPRTLPRGMMLGEGVYDVPPQVSRDVRPSDSVDSSGVLNRFSTGSDSSGELEVTGKDLPLELDSAQDTLTKLQQEAYGAIDKLVALLSSEAWRKKPSIETKVKDIKVVIFRVRQAILDLLQFAQGSLVNASHTCDPGLVKKISKLREPLEKAKTIIDDTWASQETGAWNKFLSQDTIPEQLTQLALLAPSLSEDVRHLVALIQSNATLIFKRSPTLDSQKQQEDDDKTPVQERPLPDVPLNKKGTKMGDTMYENDSSSFMEDYDYVNIESKESVEKEHEEIKKEMPDHIRKSFDNLVKQSSQLIVDNDHERAARTAVQNSGGGNNSTSSCIDPNDRQVLKFYGTQAELHMQHLNTAIDAFLLTIENNQPPKVFIAHSKFVILSAHKLVYIGDTVHRNVVNNDVRTRVLNCSNALSDGLKNTVTAVKTAALQFPSVVAVQAMVDAFVAISHLANNLKNATLGAVRS